MAEIGERLVNLALFLAKARSPVSVQRIRDAGLGYPEDQDETAFLRMFERDKDALRSFGIVIAVDECGCYRLDTEATYASPIDLDEHERSLIRLTCAALRQDPSFPFARDLGAALAKLVSGTAPQDMAASRLADEDGATQARIAELAAEAIAAQKLLSFEYTNAKGETRPHEVAPYGLFFRDGRWYLVGLDTSIGSIRVYALMRARDVRMSTSGPKTPDFERPADFSVADYTRLPFQYGIESYEAVVHFEPEEAWRAPRLVAGCGTIEPTDDGGALWRVPCADARLLASWCIEHGPGIAPVAPQVVVQAFRLGLKEVLDRHGCSSISR